MFCNLFWSGVTLFSKVIELEGVLLKNPIEYSDGRVQLG